jgi:hypothetical protein
MELPLGRPAYLVDASGLAGLACLGGPAGLVGAAGLAGLACLGGPAGLVGAAGLAGLACLSGPAGLGGVAGLAGPVCLGGPPASAALPATSHPAVPERSLCAELAPLAGSLAILGAASPARRLEVPETALEGAVAAGAQLPRIATLEVALLGGAQAGLSRAHLAALERVFGLFSSAYDAAEAPPTPPALALPSAADSPKGLSLFPASPTSALLGPAASASSKSHGPPNPGPPSLHRGKIDSIVAAPSEKPPVPPKPETHQALPPALSGSPSAICGP